MNNATGRPRGKKNAKPSREAIAGYYRLLADAADEGDVDAARHLIELDLLNNQQTKETTHAN